MIGDKVLVKYSPKSKKKVIAIYLMFLLGLLVGILVLAAYTNNLAFWIISIIICLASIGLVIHSIYKLYKPRIIAPPLGKLITSITSEGKENEESIDSLESGKNDRRT